MANVLVLATRYDSATRRTFAWASNLVQDLYTKGHAYNFIHGAAVSYTAIDHAIASTDFVIFYGHGEMDRLIGQKSLQSIGNGPTLVDTTSVNVFQGRPVYAVCCYAVAGLGRAYSVLFPNKGFIGYMNQFGISIYNQTHFAEIVNRGAMSLADGVLPAPVMNQLRNEWSNLADSFLKGPLQNSPDAFLAATVASTNARTAFVSL
jgi:hypothetical protein